MVPSDDPTTSRRTLLAAAGSTLAATTALAGCLGDAPAASDGDLGSGSAGGDGRCFTDPVSRPDPGLATVERAGVRDGAAFVVLAPADESVAAASVFADGSRLARTAVDDATRLSWRVPDAAFERVYRVALLDAAEETLATFELGVECDG